MAATQYASPRLIVFAAAGILLITMGARQSLGLFIAPINESTGLGLASISFALAIGQFVWGAIQPIAGAIADRYGPARVLVGGVIVLAIGSVLSPYYASDWGLVLTLGLLMAAGSGAGSFSVLIGAASARLPAEKRGMASGIINAGGSFGQFVFAPLLQKLISVFGWGGALGWLGVIVLAALPLTWPLRGRSDVAAAAAVKPVGTMRRDVAAALRDPSYLLLHAGFFTCGFHIAFLVTHLPGEVALCGLSTQVAGWSLAIIGLSNVVGSLVTGWAIQRWRSKWILFGMYASRAVLIGIYLLAPKTPMTFYLFALGLGATWLATVPPTAAIVGKLFGTRYLATLFGLTLFSHQIGGFLGAWLGGIAMTRTGSYALMWYADIALAILAAASNLPIREARLQKPLTAQPA